MARPLKDEADYFPLNVKFIQDNKIKLLKSEFGFQCVTVIIAILSEIYGEYGYYMKWDDDACLLMSEGVGGGCKPEYIREVVHGCLRRSLFDERVFKMFGILTSRGIQKRYVRIFEKREEIRIIREYFLLDIADKQDVPSSIKDKIIFKDINGVNNGVSVPDNTQSKVKESKVKEESINTFSSEHDSDGEKSDVKKTKSKKKNVYGHDSKYYKSALWLAQNIENSVKGYKPHTESQLQSWADTARLIIEKDKRDVVLTRKLLMFARNSDFWKKNILSMGKFREQFDQLLVRYNEENGG